MITEDEFASIAEIVLGDLTDVPVTYPKEFLAQCEDDGVVIRLLYVPQTGEWSLVLLQPAQVDPPFELPDLLRVTACPEPAWRPFDSVIAQDGAVAQRVLLRATAALQAHGQDYLAGDDSAFSVARRARSERAAAYTTSVNQAGAIREATASWAAGDMSGVVEALSPLRGSLPADQERRLSYAESRRANSES